MSIEPFLGHVGWLGSGKGNRPAWLGIFLVARDEVGVYVRNAITEQVGRAPFAGLPVEQAKRAIPSREANSTPITALWG
jgi:hypothetical protein